MTQQNTTTNFLIQGHNGQMVKLIQATKPISGIITTSMSGQPVKIFKTGVNSPETSQGTQIIRTLSLPPTKIVTKPVPIHVGNLPKVTTKTIKITPSQIQSFKMLHTTPKLQTVSGPLASTISGSQGTKIMSPHILSRKRMDPLELDYTPETKRARKSEKVGKGLRHFSMKVCEKVKQKGTTTYNEVADELVGEFTRSSSPNTLADQYDQKNIRRRVYDALNVLMAMNIISKEKKEIRWIGLPTNSFQECHQLQRKIEEKEKSIKLKQNQLNDLILNQIAFKNLAQRNRETEKAIGPPPINSYIQLPFLVVNTNKKAVINCSISNDKMEYLFQFSDRFEINDDLDILKSIGMLKGLHTGDCTPEDLESIKSLVPQSLWPYVDNIASGKANENTASSSLQAEDFVEATIDEESSRPSSSFDPLSPSVGDYSDEELESDISSETELN